MNKLFLSTCSTTMIFFLISATVHLFAFYSMLRRYLFVSFLIFLILGSFSFYSLTRSYSLPLTKTFCLSLCHISRLACMILVTPLRLFHSLHTNSKFEVYILFFRILYFLLLVMWMYQYLLDAPYKCWQILK